MQEKIAQWGVRNLHNTNKLGNTLVFPYNEKSHQSFFILEPHHTLHFDSIMGYHIIRKANQFVKCTTFFGWSYTKGILHNSNECLVIGTRSIVHVLVPKQNGAWEFGYLVVKYFSRYLNKHGDREHCHGVEVNFVTCNHLFFTTILNMFQHHILIPNVSSFKKTPCNAYFCMFMFQLHFLLHLHLFNLCRFHCFISRYDYQSPCFKTILWFFQSPYFQMMLRLYF